MAEESKIKHVSVPTNVVTINAEAVQILDDFRHVQHRFHQVGHAYYADMVSRSVEMMVLDMYHIHALQYSDDLKGVDQSAFLA